MSTNEGKFKAYWIDKNAQVETPIEYGYTQGWTEFLDNIEFFIFILLALVICIAPIFVVNIKWVQIILSCLQS